MVERSIAWLTRNKSRRVPYRGTTAFAGAAAKRLRWALWHTPGRLVRSGRRTTVRLPANHPTTPHLTRIYDHIAAFHRHRRRRPQKHHNRHHKPPGGPTTRAPTPTTRPKQHPTNTPPKDPNKNQTTPKTILMNNQG